MGEAALRVPQVGEANISTPKKVGIAVVTLLIVFAVWFIVLQSGRFRGQERIPAKLLTPLQSLAATFNELKSIQQDRLKSIQEDTQLINGMIDLIRRNTYSEESAARRLEELCRRMGRELQSLTTVGEFQIAQILEWQRSLEKMRLGAGRSEVAADLEKLLSDTRLPRVQFRLSALNLREIRGDIDQSIPSFNDRELRSGLATLGIIYDHATEDVRGFEQLEALSFAKTSAGRQVG